MSVLLVAADYWMPYLLVQPVDTMALKGRTVALQCSAASSVEHVSIHWRKNNVALHETPHKITVSAATPLSPPPVLSHPRHNVALLSPSPLFRIKCDCLPAVSYSLWGFFFNHKLSHVYVYSLASLFPNRSTRRLKCWTTWSA